MKLKLLAWVVLLAANGAYAAPTLQICTPMEVSHRGGSGLSYTLTCDAGSWALTYRGSLPAGTNSVLARYRVQVRNPDGTNLTQNREVRLPSPALLGQALQREAVVLEGGTLALRDCPEFNCTLYRPFGVSAALTAASVTVTPEVKRLTDEAIRLSGELSKRKAELVAQGDKAARLEQEVATLSAKLQEAGRATENARKEVTSVKEQREADLAGFLNSSKSELIKVQGEMSAQADAKIAALNALLQSAVSDLDKVRQDLAESTAAHLAADIARNRAGEAVAAQSQQVAELQAQLMKTTEWLATARDGYNAKVAALNTTEDHAATTTGEYAAIRLQLEAANSKLDKASTSVEALERALTDARGKLALAVKDRAYRESKASAAEGAKDSQRVELERALAAAQGKVLELTTARAEQVAELQAALATANKKLGEAQSQFDSQVMALNTTRANQADLVAAESNLAKANSHVEQLTQKVATLEQSLDKASQALAAMRTAQDLSAQGAVGAQTDLAKARKAFEDGTAAHESETADLRAQLAQRLSEREIAEEKVKLLQQELDDQAVKLLKADAERADTLTGSKKVAENMLAALDAIQDLQRTKADAEKALESSTNKVMEQATKLEAANLARELAMQAANAAHADADTQHIKNLELAQKLASAEASLQEVLAQRDGLYAKLQGAQAELQLASTNQHTAGAEVGSLQRVIELVTRDRDELQQRVETQAQRIVELEVANRAQAEKLAATQLELAALKGVASLVPPIPVVCTPPHPVRPSIAATR